ncbi:BURP domain protein RD22-like [Prosopis cineraria]|uniref:BURP domain protein RD22-like n=1 Tax=Prosopis cineraria TaxID=364024 RepID=UPI0024105A76|nr:BURP domain protein RD22-like [Prosopis cineraria]
MASQIFPIFGFLTLAMVATQAALTPELYWLSKLPTTPMPKAITNLLHPEWKEDKSTSVDVGNGGVNVDTGKSGAGGGTNVDVGKGGVAVNAGHKGKPVYVNVGQPFQYLYAATETQLHHDPNAALFFMEKDMYPGKELNLHFTKTTQNAIKFLPQQVSKRIPFSSSKIPEIFTKLSVKPGSLKALTMKNTIKECEVPGIRAEEKYCATSLESMVEFTTSKLGKNLWALSTEVDEKETHMQKYIMTVGARKMRGPKAIVCHLTKYPYAVFYCHKTEATRAYYVPLESEDGGSKVKAVAICHTDTSQWNPKHLAFQVLKVKPGTAPVCHFLPEDHLVWIPK